MFPQTVTLRLTPSSCPPSLRTTLTSTHPLSLPLPLPRPLAPPLTPGLVRISDCEQGGCPRGLVSLVLFLLSPLSPQQSNCSCSFCLASHCSSAQAVVKAPLVSWLAKATTPTEAPKRKAQDNTMRIMYWWRSRTVARADGLAASPAAPLG